MEIEPKNQRRNFRSEKFVCSHFLAEWKTAYRDQDISLFQSTFPMKEFTRKLLSNLLKKY